MGKKGYNKMKQDKDELPLLFRFHQGGLDQSMETIIEIRSFDHLLSHIRSHWDVPISHLNIVPYCFDDRIGWDTHMVQAALGTDPIILYPIGFLNRHPNWIIRENTPPISE
jgi:hypothetical protein